MWAMNFQMFKLDLEKAEEPEIKLPTLAESWKKQESSRKISAAAKSLQSCPTLCNPIDGSPPGSPVPGILQAIVIPACALSSLVFHMMYSTYKSNKQGDNIQPWCTPFPIWNQSVVPCPILTVASWPKYRLLSPSSRGRSGGLVFPSL